MLTPTWLSLCLFLTVSLLLCPEFDSLPGSIPISWIILAVHSRSGLSDPGANPLARSPPFATRMGTQGTQSVYMPVCLSVCLSEAILGAIKHTQQTSTSSHSTYQSLLGAKSRSVMCTHPNTVAQPNRQTDRQTDRQAYRQIDRQPDIQTDKQHSLIVRNLHIQ